MSFIINAGRLQTIVREDPPVPGEFLEAGYEITIDFNGSTLFHSSVLLSQVDAGNGIDTLASVVENGTSLGGVLTNPRTGAPDEFVFEWDAYTGTLDLGQLQAGETALLEYEVRTFVRSSSAAASPVAAARTPVWAIRSA